MDPIRKTKKANSIDSGMSEDVMFGSFAKAVLEPVSEDGELWECHSPDNLADHFISLGNKFMKNSAEMPPKT